MFSPNNNDVLIKTPLLGSIFSGLAEDIVFVLKVGL
jgi:hypothetical protein